MANRPVNPVPLLLPIELGKLFGVGPKTALRWVQEKRITAIRTLGGHHRFHPDEVRRVLMERYSGDVLSRRLKDLDEMVAGRMELGLK